MYNINKSFSIKDVVINDNSSDLDFAIMELWCLAEGNNSHHNPITRDVLERDAHTFKGKFIIGKYSEFTKDVRSHEVQEDIYGYISVLDEPEFKTKVVDGIEKEFVVVNGLVSKIYCQNIIEMFEKDNDRSVSCEFNCTLQYEEDEYGRPLDDFGVPMDCDNPILSYEIRGVTLLGKNINPSVKGANAIIKRFSEDAKISDNEEMKAMAENYYHEFSQRKSSDLELAIRNLVDVVLTNKEFSQDENQNVKETQMEKKTEIFEESAKEEDVIMEEAKEEELAAPETQDEEDKAEMAEDSKDEETQDDEKELAEDSAEDEKEDDDADDKEMSCGEKDEEMSCDKSMSEEDADINMMFSLRENIEAEVFEALDENVKEFAEKLVDMSAVEILNEAVRLFSEVKELSEYKCVIEDEKREKKFASIMASVKEDLDEKTFAELSEEGKNVSLDELGAFENKVKATAFEQAKNNIKKDAEEPEIMVFAGNDNISGVENLDVFERISRA